MEKNIDNNFNLFDYFGFPNRNRRAEIQQICDVNKLQLIRAENCSSWFHDNYFGLYNTWSNHINNFSSNLWLHFLLMNYQYDNHPPEILENIDEQDSSAIAHKIFYDTFIEDVSLYLISYLDKHLEMYNSLYDFQGQAKNKRKLSRNSIISEMKTTNELTELSKEYQSITQSEEFKAVKQIRDNFVHNKSSSHLGEHITKYGNGVTAYGISHGIETRLIYSIVCILLKRYENLCLKVNEFMIKKVENSQYTSNK